MTTLQASLHVADWPVATSPRDARRPASTSTFLPMPGATLPRTLASPRTGLAPAGYPELVTRLHPISLHSLSDTFADARAAGRTPEIQLPRYLGVHRALAAADPRTSGPAAHRRARVDHSAVGPAG